MVPTFSRACLIALMATAFSAVFAADAVAQGSVASALDGPLRSIHNSGNSAHNKNTVEDWEQDPDPSKPLLPPGYVEYLKSTHISWVGISMGLHVDDSMDSVVKRKYSRDIDIPTFTDEVLRQIVRESGNRSRGPDPAVVVVRGGSWNDNAENFPLGARNRNSDPGHGGVVL